MVYTVTSGETERDTTFRIDFKDIAGNEGVSKDQLSVSNSIRIDTSVPILSTVSLSTDRGIGDSFAKMGDKIKLEFKSSESIKIPQIYITNEIVEVSGSNQNWFAFYDVKSGDDYKLNSPTELSGISLWLDASNIDGENNRTINIDDPISQWKDLSGGNTKFAYQEDSLKQPKLKSSSLMYPVINFDGDDDYLIGSYENSFSNKYISVFLIKRQDDNNRQNTFISTNEDYGYTRYDITHWDNTENTIVYFRDQSDVSKHIDIFTNTNNFFTILLLPALFFPRKFEF